MCAIYRSAGATQVAGATEQQNLPRPEHDTTTQQVIDYLTTTPDIADIADIADSLVATRMVKGLCRFLCFLIVNIVYMLLLSLDAFAYMSDSSRVAIPHRHRGGETAIFHGAAPKATTIDTASLTDVILFDGVCNFCNRWVDIILKLDVDKKFKFASMQSNIGKELLERIGRNRDDISSVILLKSVSSKEHYAKSEAVLNVVKELRLGPVAYSALSAVFPLGLRDGIYDIVAENRYSILGRREECRCSDPRYSDRFL